MDALVIVQYQPFRIEAVRITEISSPPSFSLADAKKDEGNELYKTKNYRDALQRYSEAISK